ncbi:MAG: hypothetical protein ACI841_004899 [Planctomycetota bacterium]|jgi:hypothetical protein
MNKAGKGEAGLYLCPSLQVMGTAFQRMDAESHRIGDVMGGIVLGSLVLEFHPCTG